MGRTISILTRSRSGHLVPRHLCPDDARAGLAAAQCSKSRLTYTSILDNVPTYLGFLIALMGATQHWEIQHLLITKSINLVVISVGAVFFEANTYIGKGLI